MISSHSDRVVLDAGHKAVALDSGQPTPPPGLSVFGALGRAYDPARRRRGAAGVRLDPAADPGPLRSDREPARLDRGGARRAWSRTCGRSRRGARDARRPPTIDEIRAARERLQGVVVRTPLIRLNADGLDAEVWIKLENLQPIGSFKLRGAANAMRLAGPDALRDGVYTASAGNMAQGVAWSARELGVPCTVVVPDHAPATKLAGGRAARRQGREAAVRPLVAGGGGALVSRHRRAVRAPGVRPGA